MEQHYVTVTLCLSFNLKTRKEHAWTPELAGGSTRAFCSVLGPLVRHGTRSLGHLSRPGHRVIILTRCETRVFPVFEKSPT